MSDEMSVSNRLALDRTRLAYERTLMAWVRTATSLISFGFTIFKFFQFLREDRPALSEGAIGPRGFALLMIVIGLTALLLATLEHRRHLNALRTSYGPLPISLAAVVAALIAVLGVLGLASVLFAL
jgi:inner membrane protein YidH